MSTEHDEGLHPPRTIHVPQLYAFLLERLPKVQLRILQTPPRPYENTAEQVFECEEAFQSWVKYVGADKGVMDTLEAVGGPLCVEMTDDLFNLNAAMDHIEHKLGMRFTISDGSMPRPDPFQHFNSLIYTLNSKTQQFKDFAASHPRSQTPRSTATPPPSGLRKSAEPSDPQSFPSRNQSDEMDGMEDEASNQSHLRNDSHSYIKKEEPSPLQRDYSMSSPSLSYDTRLSRPDSRVKMEDVQTDYLRQTNPTPIISRSVSISPNVLDPAPVFSPAGSSPNAVEPWSPQTPSNALPYSSIEERNRAHDNWASKVLHRDEHPVVMPTIIPQNPLFSAVPQFPSINHHFPPILPPPGSLSLATTPPRSGFYLASYQQSPSSSPSTRRPDS